MSHKPEQLAHEIQKAIQEILARGLSDPRISGLITITKTKVQADLKRAEVSVSILPADRQELTMHGLHSAEKHIRRQVGDIVRTRSIPEIVFVLDGSLKKEAAVLEDLRRLREDGSQHTTGFGSSQGAGGTTQGSDAAAPASSKDHA